MSSLRSLLAGWRRWKEAAARELLRDPDVVLFERAGGPLHDGQGDRDR
ncbi:hypothetical protein [Sphingobium sp.]|nr:hypothetical protein [Sphingobium sp.]